MRDYYTVKVNMPGGIVAPGTLQTILTMARDAQVRTVRFGARQQLLMTVHYEDMRFLEKDLKQQSMPYEVNTEQYPNVISSYCGEDVFRAGAWLRESEYHTILDQFDYGPRLKVNLSDFNQSFTPFFTGNLNFITSPEPHFFYLYIRPKQTNTLFRWPELIYTNDVGRLAKAIEEAMLDGGRQTEEEIYKAVMTGQSFITQPAVKEIDLPEFSLPYYEGFNRYGQRSWLGLYRRDEQFSVAFLLDVCALCLKTRIGELCVTTWKSLIIKGIEEKDRAAWSYVLGKHNINVRHAANELAWQTEDQNEDGAQLKNYIIRFFAKNDTRTFGLVFWYSDPAKIGAVRRFGIRLRSDSETPLVADWSVVPVQCIRHLFYRKFQPEQPDAIICLKKGLFKMHLPNQLHRLCRKFNAGRIQEGMEPVRQETEKVEPAS